jgi:acetyl-CoA carboxylase biotin carboxyl carrier protein
VTELTHEDVGQIIKIIDEMGDRDVHLEVGDLKLHVTRSGVAAPASPIVAATPPAPVATPAATLASAQPVTVAMTDVPSGHVAIRAPTMGTFYRASSPGAKPHAEIGDRVKPDDTVGVFEVMKLFSTLQAGLSGTITAIPAPNEAMVEQDQVLVIIKPD